MFIWDTEKRKKVPFSPEDRENVKVYTCGPTVYNYAHIGNFRTYVFEDLLCRTLRFCGLKVRQIMNITDIDDKTIAGAIKMGVPLDAFCQPFIDAFHEDLQFLQIQPAESYPHATGYIDKMVAMISQLLEKGYAYQGGDGSVYYAINKCPNYGRLSGLVMEDLQEGASKRVSQDEYDKCESADFVLWKGHDPQRDGSIFWESPFGRGRPGWHIECSAMAFSLLGESIDLHVGGVDNIFPHHENEIAQSESCSGKLFSRYWMHSDHLMVDGKKMAKSAGNFYTLRDLVQKGYSGLQIRYLLLKTHYRAPLNFTFEGLEAAQSSLERIADFLQRLQGVSGPDQEDCAELIACAEEDFRQRITDDLNISAALAVLFDLITKGNQLCERGVLGDVGREAFWNVLQQWDDVLGVIPFSWLDIDLPEGVQEALIRREEARTQKDWATADQERDFIHAAGFLVEDTADGPKVKKRFSEKDFTV